MAAARESSLVNFRALQEETSPDKRAELLRNVLALLGLVSDRCGDGLLATYDSVMLRLSDMVDEVVRAEVAQRLADMKRAPGGIIRKLARDEIEIAQPLIVRSPMLSDHDLVGIAEIRGNPHRRAIAVRPSITEIVTAAILARGDDGVRRLAAGNVTARFETEGFQRLLVQAKSDLEMQDLITSHPGTPATVLETLTQFGNEDIRQRARRRLQTKEAGPSFAPGEVPAPDAFFDGLDFKAASERIRLRQVRGALDIAIVGQLAADNEFAQVAVALAELSGFRLKDVLNWFSRREVDVVLVIARALGGKSQDFARLLKAGPWLFRISAEERAQAVEKFEALDVGAAKERLARQQRERAA